MEFWEITSKRAQQTLAVWSRHASAWCIGTQGVTELRRLIVGFGPLVQARAAAQADYWEAFYCGQAALRDLKQLGKRVALILHGHLDDDTPLMRALQVVYQTAPRTAATILQRVQELLPLWERVNAERTACSSPQAPTTCMLRGQALDVAAVHELLEAYQRTVETIQAKAAVLQHARAALRTHERATDRLNKRWYQMAKASTNEGSALAEALHGITTTAGGWARPLLQLQRPRSVLQQVFFILHSAKDGVTGGLSDISGSDHETHAARERVRCRHGTETRRERQARRMLALHQSGSETMRCVTAPTRWSAGGCRGGYFFFDALEASLSRSS